MRQKPIHPSMQPFLEGQMILLDKPLHWTSFDAVREIRRLTGVNKVGHAGTLDPLASGLLILCTGSYTKRINEFMAQTKEYTGTITIGSTTQTYDLESTPENFKDFHHITSEDILRTATQFTGAIAQYPPIHSAIKQGGKPIYLAARKGEEVIVEPRNITIYAFEITRIALPEVDFRVQCSTGTYIRSLAHDFGTALGVGGHLSRLRRTKIGNFSVEQAYQIEDFDAKIRTMKGESL